LELQRYGYDVTIGRPSSGREIGDNWEKYVVSWDEVDFGISEGIKHIHVMRLGEVL
jgi:hypothetical protein